MSKPRLSNRWFGQFNASGRDAGRRDAGRWDAGRWIVIGGSLCLALFFAFLGRQALNEREALWQLQISKQADIQRMALNSTQHGMQERAQLLAETIAADAWVTELVRQAHALPASDPQSLASIRSQLYTRLAPRWRNLQAQQPFRLYVHLAPDVKVLLRVHEPEHFGDLQIGWRPMVLEALRSARSQAGLGLTRGSVGMRAIAPLQAESNNGPQQVGAIEVAMGVLEDLAQLDPRVRQRCGPAAARRPAAEFGQRRRTTRPARRYPALAVDGSFAAPGPGLATATATARPERGR